MRATYFSAFVVLCLLLNGGPVAAVHGEPPEAWQDRVDKLVSPLVEKKQLVGAMVGVLTPDGTREFFAYGVTKSEGPAPTKDTLFEIGSISKTFTTLLLALLVEQGMVKLEDPVRQLLPQTWTIPKRGEREITLLELATHTSGLPNNPPSLLRALAIDPKIQLDPFARFDEQQLAQCLAELKLKDVATPPVDYSNLGMGLLGEAVAHQTGMSYDALVRGWIAEPLKLRSTIVLASEDEQARTATGHDSKGQAVPYWKFGTLSGAGAIRSTADDMLSYLAAQSGGTLSPLSQAMEITQMKRAPAFGIMHVGLGWFIQKHKGQNIWWHNGGTNGFTSFAAFSRVPAVAVVVLSNSGPDGLKDGQLIDEVGNKLIRKLFDTEPVLRQ